MLENCIRMKDEEVRCPVCGCVMERRGSVPTKLGRVRRYRCTCGNHADIKDDSEPRQPKESASVMPEGIQELV